ncbi:hypothetical protein NAEGRDRAFT_57076 [Naegleria gruberi]|uniref:V-SNARE coiled-coil homology domain-containing protein n=1 Tax=Naegleria gruberi TaxID=5762 RepID=D2V475_NAEGR|nr:uncharacterized protein NAEGRDRAFT_57076 [Naegleria gruberi]EFC48470.1 hypothetical protein NAEGRDRAFT_57076 [Naegleria gruberi]|eukprot:XP_002681214.1 hypothetical protein NAEGRDRAFT_57076 [Naegleria gruberi strain NEG-M]
MESFENVLQLQKLLTFCSDARDLLIHIENPFIKAYGVDAYNQVEEEFNLVNERIQKLYQSKKQFKYVELPSLPETDSLSKIVSNIQKHLIEQKNQESSLLDEFGELNEDDDLQANEQEEVDTQQKEQEKTKEELSKLTSMLKEKAQQVNEFIKSDVDSIKRKSVILEKSKSSLDRAQTDLNQQISLAKTYLYSQITFIVVVLISFVFMLLLITVIPRII